MNTQLNPKLKRKIRRIRSRNRKGATLVLAVALMFVLLSFLAFSIDTGYLAQSRAEIRRTADAAAMAGCWELYSQLELGITDEATHPYVRTAASSVAALNPVCRHAPALDHSAASQEISIGYLDGLLSPTISNDDSLPYFAVQVTVNRTTSANGEIPFFFGRIFGQQGRPMTSQATAVMAHNIDGFRRPQVGSYKLDVLPFALDVDTWNNMMSHAISTDDYAFDPVAGAVSSGSDNILEINLYPQGTGSPGNRGTVDIGGANNSTNDIARQIIDGISPQDLDDLGKPLALCGSSMTLNGDTGISAGVKDELESIIGQKRIIPVFSNVSGNGNNAVYTIVQWVGVRIMHVKLTGKMSGKQLIVQPAHVICPYTITNTSGTSTSDFVLSPVILAR